MSGPPVLRAAAAAALLSLLGCTSAGDPAKTAIPVDGPRNVILFVGDGMGISTITAARIHAGQKAGGPGEDYSLNFDRFPNTALIKTYNTDAQVPDSAGTMTAMITGEKTRMGVLSVAASVPKGDCAAALGNALPTLLEAAEAAGLRTGIVTTTRITHATPAAAYAHSPDRDWESDDLLPEAARRAGCVDIARQLVSFSQGDGVDVMLGGGRGNFLPESTPDPEYPEVRGRRADGRDLIAEWCAGGPRRYLWRADDFQALDAGADEQILGLFEPSHMKWEADRLQDPAGEPSLADMTGFAVDKLRNDTGFLLIVEGGRIDHAHHFGNAYRALEDTLALDAAVAAAVARVDLNETLIIVTADHSHTLTISGYPVRGNPILGKVRNPAGEFMRDSEGLPYTTLGYANGPGAGPPPADFEALDTTGTDYQQRAAVPLPIETHAGEDVAAFAVGVNAQAVHGVMEQNRLYEVMRAVLFPQRFR